MILLKRTKTFLLIALCVLLPAPLLAETICPEPVSGPRDTSQASAGVFANLTKQSGSLRVESERLVSKALSERRRPAGVQSECPDACPHQTFEIVFTTIPSSFLSEYADLEHCEQQRVETERSPLRYENRQFANISDFSDWFHEFSTGKGDDGENLYQRCDRSCSPQYTSVLTPNDKGIRVSVSVVCGPARNKDENLYNLGIQTVRNCVTSPSK